MLWAVQTTNSRTSEKSAIRVVERLREPLPQPWINHPAWECSRRVGSDGIVPGVELILSKSGTPIASEWPTEKYGDYWATWTGDPLAPVGAKVSVQQVYCADPVSGEVTQYGPVSDSRAIEQSPNPMPPFDSVLALSGMERIEVDGALIGSNNRFYEDNISLNGVYAKHNHYRYITGTTVLPDQFRYTATQTLCEGSTSTETFAKPIPADEVQKMLSAIEIKEPICPGTTAIQVHATLPGRVVLTYNDEPLGRANIPSGEGTIAISGGLLAEGGKIGLRQIAIGSEALNGNIVGDETTAIVGPDSQLRILGAEDYVDQNSGDRISGFVRNGDQRSRGPQFEFFCCSACDCADCELVERDGQCLENGESRTVAVEIYLKDKHVADVTLYEDFPGHYVGRWDWFVDEHDIKVDLPTWPPPASDEYVAVVVDSPCGDNYKQPFRVFVGEKNANDSTAPESVKLTITRNTVTSTVTETDSAEPFLIWPGQTAGIKAVAYDPDGLYNVVIEDASSRVDSPLNKVSDENIIPIPTALSLETTLSPLDPYDESQIHAVAKNYSGQQISTQTLIVRGRHVDPVIERISPNDTIAPGEHFKIIGDHLAYPTLETEIYFRSSDGTRSANISWSSINQWNLFEVQVPTIPFNGYNGPIDVWVVTRALPEFGTVERISNIKTIQYQSCLESGMEYYSLNVYDYYYRNGPTLYRGAARPPTGSCTPTIKVQLITNPNDGVAMNFGCSIDVSLMIGESLIASTGWILPGGGISPGSAWSLDANTRLQAMLPPADNYCTPNTHAIVQVHWTTTQ